MTVRHQSSRLAAVAIILGTLACAAPVFAADAPAADGTMHMMHKHPMDKMHAQHNVENRIKSLHEKLGITPEQESAWGNVADAMRDNDKSMHELMHERHEHAEGRTAVEDLQSYQKIAQAHADGLQKVIDAFSTLYDSMSDEQKANADKVFGHFEGHEHGEHAEHDGGKSAGK